MNENPNEPLLSFGKQQKFETGSHLPHARPVAPVHTQEGVAYRSYTTDPPPHEEDVYAGQAEVRGRSVAWDAQRVESRGVPGEVRVADTPTYTPIEGVQSEYQVTQFKTRPTFGRLTGGTLDVDTPPTREYRYWPPRRPGQAVPKEWAARASAAQSVTDRERTELMSQPMPEALKNYPIYKEKNGVAGYVHLVVLPALKMPTIQPTRLMLHGE